MQPETEISEEQKELKQERQMQRRHRETFHLSTESKQIKQEEAVLREAVGDY